MNIRDLAIPIAASAAAAVAPATPTLQYSPLNHSTAGGEVMMVNRGHGTRRIGPLTLAEEHLRLHHYLRLHNELKLSSALAEKWFMEPPSEEAVAAAWRVLDALKSEDLIPVKVLPSAEGGIGIAIHVAPKLYADIEIFNDGEVVATLSPEATLPEIWRVEGQDALSDAVRRICDTIRS